VAEDGTVGVLEISVLAVGPWWWPCSARPDLLGSRSEQAPWWLRRSRCTAPCARTARCGLEWKDVWIEESVGAEAPLPSGLGVGYRIRFRPETAPELG